MTVEHRMVVSLSEIRTLTLECKKCHARLSTTPEDVGRFGLATCPACLHPWISESTTTARTRTAALAVLLGALPAARASEEEDAVGVRILLEFEASPHAA
jgi:hypothetical protein